MIDGKLTSAEKVVFILKLLSEHPYELSMTQIAQALAISKSSTLKILAVLTDGHLLFRNPSTKKYSLGPAVFRLGVIYSDLTGLVDSSRPLLEAVTRATGRTSYVAMWDGDGAFMAVKNEMPDGMRFEGQVGRRFPINGGAIGKVIAAYQPAEVITALLGRHPLEKLGPNSITDPDELLAEFSRIREQGHALSDREYRDGGFGIAAPIFDRRGDIVAGLAVVGRQGFTPENIRSWTQVVIDAAAEASRRLLRL